MLRFRMSRRLISRLYHRMHIFNITTKMFEKRGRTSSLPFPLVNNGETVPIYVHTSIPDIISVNAAIDLTQDGLR